MLAGPLLVLLLFLILLLVLFLILVLILLLLCLAADLRSDPLATQRSIVSGGSAGAQTTRAFLRRLTSAAPRSNSSIGSQPLRRAAGDLLPPLPSRSEPVHESAPKSPFAPRKERARRSRDGSTHFREPPFLSRSEGRLWRIGRRLVHRLSARGKRSPLAEREGYFFLPAA